MMKNKKNLARKILCGLLAAGVVGVAGSAMAASYGIKFDGSVTEDHSSNGTVSGYDYGMYTKNGAFDFKYDNIKVDANQYGVYVSKDGIVNIGETNTSKVAINVIHNTTGAAHGLSTYCGNLNVLGSDINIEVNNTVAGARAINNGKNPSAINVGASDTKNVTVSAIGATEAYGINNAYKNNTVKILGNKISINTNINGITRSKSEGIYNASGSEVILGDNKTNDITIVSKAETDKVMASAIETSGKVTLNASNVTVKANAISKATAIDSVSSEGVNIKNAKVVNIEADSDSAAALALNGKADIEADKITLSANSKGEQATAYGISTSKKYNVNLKGNDVTVSASGYTAETIMAQQASDDNAIINIDSDNINIVANATNEARALAAQDAGKVTVGNGNSVINVKANAEKAYGIVALAKGAININGSSLNIDVTSDADDAQGIHVQNNSIPGSTDSFATVNINTAKTVINAKTGIAAYSQGVVNMNDGDVEINAEKAIETRGYATTNINQDGSHTVKIKGDINFNVTDDGKSGTIADANVNINLSNADSYLTGSVNKTIPEGLSEDVNGMNIDISNKAAWNMTGDSFVNNATVSDGGSINLQAGVNDFDAGDITLNKGNLSLQGNEQEVNIQNLNGTGGTINTDSVNNIVFVNDKASNTKVNVNGTSKVTDQIASGNATLQDLANVVTNMETEKETSLADTVTSDANDIIGGYSADVKDGKIVAGSEKTYENPTNRAISDMASISLMTWRQENNDMNKRLGELRDSKGEHGAWARMARGESKYGAQNVKNQYNYYQVGYDEKLSVNPNWTVGVALTRTEGNSTFAAGSGENKHTGVAVYGSYLNDNGSFIDLIAKYARMDNDYKTIGAGVGNADYETNGYSVSAEYGKRFTKDSGFWIEPQVELTYGKVSSANYLTSKGAKVYQEGMDSLVARLGFSLGKNIKQGNIYARASYLYDFDGETKATMTGAGSASFEQDLGGGWWEVGVGTNLNLSDATHLYFDVEKTYGGNVATPWQWNAGVRWSF